MYVRDAVEADAPALATIADTPTEAMRGVIHDRTVHVALADSAAPPGADGGAGGAATDPGEESTPGGETDPADVLGFLSFDVRDGTVHVTQFGGSADACARLLEEPLRFAASEAMGVELLVLDGEDEMRVAAEDAGFERDGPGPQFEGKRTTKYRHEAP